MVPEIDNLTGNPGRSRMRDRDAAIAAEAERGTPQCEIARIFDIYPQQVSLIIKRWKREHKER